MELTVIGLASVVKAIPADITSQASRVLIARTLARLFVTELRNASMCMAAARRTYRYVHSYAVGDVLVETIATHIALQARCIGMAWTLARLLVTELGNTSTPITHARLADSFAVDRAMIESIPAHITLPASSALVAQTLARLLITELGDASVLIAFTWRAAFLVGEIIVTSDTSVALGTSHIGVAGTLPSFLGAVL